MAEGFIPRHGGYKHLLSDQKNPVISANVIIGLIRVASHLLDRQIRSLEQEFLKSGGLREAMARARRDQRNRTQQ